MITPRIILALVLVFAFSAWSQARPAQPGVPAWQAYVDPLTGKLATPPIDTTSPRSGVEPQRPVTISPGRSAAGGTKVEMGARGMHSLEARAVDGRAEVECAPR